MRDGSAAWAWLGLHACAISAWLALDDPRRRFAPFLITTLVAGLSAARLAHRLDRDGLSLGQLRTIWTLALAARLAALGWTPAFSEDVHRYVYEGRATWWLGPAFPFTHPPSSLTPDAVPPALLDESWKRLNHAEITTLYPPLSQAVFTAVAALAPDAQSAVLALRFLFVLAELGGLLIAKRAAGRTTGGLVFWLLAPVAIGEIAREGHHDALSLLGLALFVAACHAGRPLRAHAGLAIATLAKLNGLLALPALVRETRRGLVFGLAPLALLAVPFVAWSSRGLTGYATRWQGGEGVFALVDAAATALLGGDWARLGPWTITHGELARAITAALLLASLVRLCLPPAGLGGVPARAGTVVLLTLLLGPTLHPWYTLWLLPFLGERGPWRAAATWLVVVAPALHHPAYLALVEGEWRELRWVPALIHGGAWLSWAWVHARRART